MAKADDTTGILVLGGGFAAAGAYALYTRKCTPAALAASSGPTVDYAPAAWVHPVPSLGERPAVTSNPFRATASADGKAAQHLGADLMFRRKDARDLIAAFPAGSPGGTAMFFMPENIPVLAASAGVVKFAADTPTGNTVIVSHGNGWNTYYTHLATLAVRVGERVVVGATLGTIGASPQDAERLRHLHFEMWNGTRARAVDPDPFLAAWGRHRMVWTPQSAATSPRNGTMSAYRPVGDVGERYPEWVQRLRGESGVYSIREIDGPIVYVGSSVGRLYETLTRHFQAWRRYKGYWRGQYAEGADPGQTYKRNRVEAAIKLTSPDDAHEEELRMIRRLAPRDNLIGQNPPEPELEAAPF